MFKFLLSFIFIFLFLIHKKINCFYVLPFDTIFIKDETINATDYHTKLVQSELYVNLSIGTPEQKIKTILKMDKYGFLIYEGALNYNKSETYEKVDEDLRISWLFSYISIPSKDHLYLPSFNTYNDLYNTINTNNDNINNYNIHKTNKTVFLRIQQKPGTSHNFNKMFNNYGIIGLKFNNYSIFNAPEFILSLKAINETKTYSFSFKFESYKKNNFAINNNKGYFIFGEELIDDENEKDNINYTICEKYGSSIIWGLRFDNIYTKLNKDKDEIIENNFTQKRSEIYINFPYLIGTDEYFRYINKTFFNELIDKKVFYCNNLIKDGNIYSYVCDSKSKYFMDYLDTNFPELIFEYKELGINFTLNKNDLFAYNHYNDSDTNLYFLIINNLETDHSYYYSWVLGIPFLKKYRLSFNYDTKMIGYYRNDGKIIEKEKNNNNNKVNFFESTVFKIIIIIILVIIIFVLGMLFQKTFQKNRKKKANELDDNYEYEPYKDKINNENDNKNNNGNNSNKIGIDSIN